MRVVCQLRLILIYHIFSWFSWGKPALLFGLCAWIQKILELPLHGQQLAKDNASRHWFSQILHRDAIANLNDWELGASVSCGTHAQTLDQIYFTNSERFHGRCRYHARGANLRHYEAKVEIWHIHHHSETNYLRRRLKIAEWIGIFHPQTLWI